MSKRIGSTPFKDLLANSLAEDEQIYAMAEALDQVLNRLARSIPELLIFARLAHDSGFINPVPMLPPMKRLADLAGGLVELEPKLLDLLGWQLHVECYDRAVSLQAKREILQSSLLLHRRHGTPWSVRHALETLLEVPAELPEWYMYGGEPYFFRVHLNITGVPVDLAWLLSAFKIIMDYKNVRSWLEYLVTYAIICLEKRTGIGLRGCIHDRQMLFFPYAPMPVNLKRTGMNLSSQTRAVYVLHFPSEKAEERIYGGANLRIRSMAKISICKE